MRSAMGKKLTHINRTMTRAQRRQADGIRAAAKRDFPRPSAVAPDSFQMAQSFPALSSACWTVASGRSSDRGASTSGTAP